MGDGMSLKGVLKPLDITHKTCNILFPALLKLVKLASKDELEKGKKAGHATIHQTSLSGFLSTIGEWKKAVF